ncbi:unnamed protein product [Brachionus calyciflorus]|uniref:Uncharacterized protein n=1 Tax=Brachionus calyciflorus TaxID=104777 RepID=A0A813S515_9BILA|nr:unnamed protein product [Brachionus calyciflorus]
MKVIKALFNKDSKPKNTISKKISKTSNLSKLSSQIMVLPKKMSSFELNFMEKNSHKNLENMQLTNISSNDDHDNSNTNKNKTSTSIYKNSTSSNADSTMKNINIKKLDSFNSHSNLPKNNTYHSSMRLYNLKLSRSKLKAVTRTSALLSGFAMVAMVELGLDYSDYFEAMKEQVEKNIQASTNALNSSMLNSTTTATNQIEMQKYLIPDSVLVFYSLVTCLLVGVHMLALMISTCILPQLEASSSEQIEFEHQLNRHEYNFLNQTLGSPNFEPKKSNIHMDDTYLNKKHDITILNDNQIIFPYQKFHKFIETAWISSTVVGIFLFLVEIGLVVFIKFYPISKLAALTGALVMVPILVLFIIFTVVFYSRLADFKISLSKNIMSQLEKNSVPFQEHVI